MSATPGSGDLSTGGPLSGEPVLISHVVTVILGAIVSAGWVSIPSPTINTIASVAAAAIATLGAFAARARVSPSGKITWGGVVDEIRSTLYDELDKIVGLAQRAAPAAPAPGPSPAPRPPSPTPVPQLTVSLPPTTSTTGPVATATVNAPVGKFTAATPFAPQPPADNSATGIHPATPPAQ